MTITKLLKLNNDIIDAFVIHYENKQVTSLWYSICESGWFKETAEFLRTPDDVILEMFYSYSKFIEQLPIQYKIDYINFYENQLGRAWTQLYMDGKEVKNFGYQLVEDMGTKWYDEAISTLKMK